MPPNAAEPSSSVPAPPAPVKPRGPPAVPDSNPFAFWVFLVTRLCCAFRIDPEPTRPPAGPGASSMRFIHAADVHLDSPLRGLDAYEGAPDKAIRIATRNAFHK